MNVKRRKKWVLSQDTLPIGRQKAIGVKLKGRKVMWVGGNTDDPTDNPADNNKVFIYDVKTRNFSATAPVPAAKHIDGRATVGVLKDGSVIVAGGSAGDPASSTSRLSYRYDPDDETWSRTGDLPEQQQWIFMPTTRLRDGRLLIAGGIGLDGVATGTGSHKAFVFDPTRFSTVDVIDPDTGIATGATAEVRGGWDYTRSVQDNSETTLARGHVFGNAVLLKDGRVFVVGGHTFWVPNFEDNNDLSALATDTDYFDPDTGLWATGAPLPPVPGEDDRIPGSHGGRTNGVGVAVMTQARSRSGSSSRSRASTRRSART